MKSCSSDGKDRGNNWTVVRHLLRTDDCLPLCVSAAKKCWISPVQWNLYKRPPILGLLLKVSLRTCSIILLHRSLKSTSIKQPTMVCQSVWYSLKKHFTGYPINQENVIYNSFINCPFSQTQSQSGHLLGIMGHWSIPGLMWMADSFPQFFMSLRLGDHKHWAKIVFSYCACYFIPDSDPI